MLVVIAVAVLAVFITYVVLSAQNPHPKGSPEHSALMLARLALVLGLWSFAFGLPAVAGFVLAIIAIVKGETKLGAAALVLCVAMPFLGAAFLLSKVTP